MKLLAALLLASFAFGQKAEEFSKRLRALAENSGEQVFVEPAPYPEAFARELKKAGHPEKKISNHTAWLLFERTQRKPMKSGLDILGIELGGGVDQVKNDVEPYLSKSEPGLLDWDIRARVALDGLGARAKYRSPQHLRAFSVGFLKYWDFPAALGAGKARDDAYGLVGQTPDKPQGGFELNLSGAFSAHLGGATTYDHRVGQKGDRHTDQRSIGLTAGVSPLGDNPGKRWNYTLLAGGSHDKKVVSSPAYAMDAEGLGWMAGAAFQLALHDVPLVPVAAPEKKPWFWFDRFRAKLTASDSAVSTLAIEASATVSVLLSQHLEVTGGLKTTLRPSPNRADPEEDDVLALGGIVGLDLRY